MIRRRFYRVPFGTPVTAKLCLKKGTEHSVHDVYILDIGAGGVGILTNVPQEEIVAAVPYLSFEFLGQNYEIYCEVLNISDYALGYSRISISFASIESDLQSQLVSLVNRLGIFIHKKKNLFLTVMDGKLWRELQNNKI